MSYQISKDLKSIELDVIRISSDANCFPTWDTEWIPFYGQLFGKLPKVMSCKYLSYVKSGELFPYIQRLKDCEYSSFSTDTWSNETDEDGTVARVSVECVLPKLVLNNNGSTYIFFSCGVILTPSNIYYYDEIPSEILDCIVMRKREPIVKYVTSSSNGYTTSSLKIQDINFEPSHYNDDIPDQKINEFIQSDDCGVAIFNGPPGTGKSYYIRSLISRNQDKCFLYMDASVFDCITSSSLIDLLYSHRNSVIIVEDCENLLKERLAGNSSLSSLLNLSDGIIGDGFKLKIICTFNAPLSKIDSAILRKGRLKVKYSFEKLDCEKANKLAASIGKTANYKSPVELCNVLCEDENNIVNADSTTCTKRIGFN